MFWLSGPKSGAFLLLCSTYVSTFSIKIGYVSNLLTYVSTSSTSVWLSWLIFFCFVDQSWVCFVFSARPMFRPSQPKSGMFRIYQPMFRLPWPLFCFSWLMFWLSGPKSGMFHLLCLTYISTFAPKLGYVSTLSTCVSISSTSVLSFLSYDLIFWTKIGYISILYSTYVSIFSTKSGYVSNLPTYVSTSLTSVLTFLTYVLTFCAEIRYVSFFVLDLCFDFRNQNRECFDFIDLCFDFLDRCFDSLSYAWTFWIKIGSIPILCSTYFLTVSTKIGYVSTLSTCVSISSTSVLSFLSYDLIFWTKIGYISILYSTYVSIFSTKIGYVSTLSTFVSTFSTSVLTFLTYVLTFWAKIRYVSSFVLDLYFDFRNRNRICFDFIDLCFEFLDICFDFLDLRFDFLDHKRVYFDFVSDLCFDFLKQKRVCFDFIDLCFDFLDLWFDFLDLSFDFLDQNTVCLDFCARPIVRI